MNFKTLVTVVFCAVSVAAVAAPNAVEGKAVVANKQKGPYVLYKDAAGKTKRCYGEVQKGDPDAPGECMPRAVLEEAAKLK